MKATHVEEILKHILAILMKPLLWGAIFILGYIFARLMGMISIEKYFTLFFGILILLRTWLVFDITSARKLAQWSKSHYYLSFTLFSFRGFSVSDLEEWLMSSKKSKFIALLLIILACVLVGRAFF